MEPRGSQSAAAVLCEEYTRLRPVSRTLAHQWDLALVLRALSKAPFEPLEQVPLKLLSAMVVLLLALCEKVE